MDMLSDFIASLSTSEAALCSLNALSFTYSIVLGGFLYSFLDIDYIITPIAEAAVDIAFAVTIVSLKTYIKDGHINNFLVAGLGSAILFNIVRINRKYVRGKKFETLDLTGKVYIITGANTGLGFETAKELAKMNATVILACRSIDRANEARASIIAYGKCALSKVVVLKLDLCGFDSVRKFVKEFKNLSLPLDCLINNAGVMMNERQLTQDGFEIVFTANHLSHFLLTNLLLVELEKRNGRIVNLSSNLHKGVKRFNFDDVMSLKHYEMFRTYCHSKLANILFTVELQKRLSQKGSKVTCNAVHPGIVRTEVTRHMSSFMQIGNWLATPIMKTLQKTPQEGAYCSVHVATSPALSGVGGEYFVHCEPARVSAGVCADDAAELWTCSERLTGLSTDAIK